MSHPFLFDLCPSGLVESLFFFSLAVLFYVILKESAWQSVSDKQEDKGSVQLFVFIMVVGLGPRASGTPGNAPPLCCYGLPRVSAPDK